MQSNPNAKNSGWRAQAGEKRSILLIGDLLMAIVALGLALYLWSLRDSWALTFWRERVAWWYYLLPFIWLLLLVNLYNPHQANNWRTAVQGVLGSALMGGAIYAVVYLLAEGNQARVGVGFFLILVSLLTVVWRLVYIRIFTSAALQRRVLVLGAGLAGETILEAYQSLTPRPFHLVGLIDDDPEKSGKMIKGIPVLGSSEKMDEIIRQEAISDLVIAVSGTMRGQTFQAVLDIQEQGVEIIPMAALYEELLGRVPVHHLESEWLIRSFVTEARPAVFYEFFKRAMDILGALVGLVGLAIIFPIIGLGILIDSGCPIFFSQARYSKGGKTFGLWKFRSMCQDAEKNGLRFTTEHDERITRMGQFLRRTHLDEVPQFWNVLKGEMSLVGPRAERPEWVTLFEKTIPFYRARLQVKPGVAGWAQVNYGYSVTIEEVTVKLEYDLYYIKHRNLLMDISIILRTIWQVVGLRGR